MNALIAKLEEYCGIGIAKTIALEINPETHHRFLCPSRNLAVIYLTLLTATFSTKFSIQRREMCHVISKFMVFAPLTS